MDLAHRAINLITPELFTDAGAPVRVGPLQITNKSDWQYVLRMPVRVWGGYYRVPTQLRWMDCMLSAAISYQHDHVGIDHPFCYVTVRHGIVMSQADDEWHTDGFSMRRPQLPDQNYIWCSGEATEYFDLGDVRIPSDFDPLRHNIYTYLEDFVRDDEVRTCEPGVMYCLDPYLLHRCPSVTVGTMRTFVRVTFCPVQIDDVNNTQNPLLPQVYSGDGVAFRRKLLNYHLDKSVWTE